MRFKELQRLLSVHHRHVLIQHNQVRKVLIIIGRLQITYEFQSIGNRWQHGNVPSVGEKRKE
jgi:hypothetical protein